MSAERSEERGGRIHWFQRMLDDIRFLILLGVVAPTIVYTVWSVVELQELPGFVETFPEAAAVLAVAADEPAAPAAADASADVVVVEMRNMAYVPDQLEVPAGTTVRWVNDDVIDHSVASGTPDTPDEERAFAGSGDFAPGETFELAFDEPGSYQIYCSTPGHYQAGMVMTLQVTEGPQ